MKTKTKNTKSAPVAVTDKSELNGNAAVLGSPLQQAWKKKRGFCLVKGCRNKADKGHFCSQHASARTRLKAKGIALEEPVDFDAVVAAAKTKAKKPTKPKAAPKAAKAEPKPKPAKAAKAPKIKAAKAPKIKAAPAPAPAPTAIPDENLL